MTELKPCPFCGEQPKLTDCAYDALTIIECESCRKTRDRMVRVEYALHDQAIQAWNTRAEREVGISKFQKITGTSYLEAKSILASLEQAGAKVVE